MSVFLLFLLTTVVGSLSTLYWIPEEDLGRGYFQMNALIILGLLGLTVAVVGLAPIEPFGAQVALGWTLLWTALAAAFLYYAAIWRERWRLCRWPLTLGLAASAALLLLVGRHVIRDEIVALPHRSLLLDLALISSALILGWSLITMLLGHWYLVAPKLTFRHLVVFCWVLLVVVVLRIAAVGSTVWAAGTVPYFTEPHPLRVLTGFGGQGMFFWFRLLWGLLIPLTLAVLSLHCARHKSNQSATGILYVLVVGSFIGEITAFYLTVTTGIPA